MNLEGKRIAVTGATGFIGRYLCAELLRRGAEVIGFPVMGCNPLLAAAAPLAAKLLPE